MSGFKGRMHASTQFFIHRGCLKNIFFIHPLLTCPYQLHNHIHTPLIVGTLRAGLLSLWKTAANTEITQKSSGFLFCCWKTFIVRKIIYRAGHPRQVLLQTRNVWMGADLLPRAWRGHWPHQEGGQKDSDLQPDSPLGLMPKVWFITRRNESVL